MASLFGFGVRLLLALLNVFGKVPPSILFIYFFGRVWELILILFQMFGKSHQWSCLVLNFCLLRGYIYIYMYVYIYIIYSFLVVLGFHCCMDFSLFAVSGCCSPVAVLWLLICSGFSCGARAQGLVGFSSWSSLTVEHRLNSCGAQA